MTTVPQQDGPWRKSSFTGSEGNCVELAWAGGVRDSKQRSGPTLSLSIRSLVSVVKTGQLDLTR